MSPEPKETATPAPARPATALQEDRPEASRGTTDAVSDWLRSGKLFGCFELQRELENGSTGAVWLAQDYGLKRHADQVTLKFLPEFIVHHKTALEDLQDQIRRIIPLRHPNILRVYDLVENKGKVAIQLEYPDGQSLSHLRLAKPNQVFEVRDLVKWAKELCGALEYAHQELGPTIVDLTPGNLIVDRAGNLKVKDFGITHCIDQSMSRLIATDDRAETRPYQSPQQAAGEKPAVTDDLYSLGAVLYELLTSKPPFHNEATGAQLSEKLLPSMSQRRIELGILGEAIPENWEETVAACLAKDPFRRPQSASEIEERLQNSSNRIPNPQSPVRPSSTHRKWLTIAGLTLILAAVSAFAFLALPRLTEPKRANPVKEPSPALPLFSSTFSGQENFLAAETRSPKVRPTPLAIAATSPEVRSTPSPELSPTPSPTVSPATSSEVNPATFPVVSSATSSQVRPRPSPNERPTISSRETAMPSGEQAPGPSPTSLSQHDIDATKEEVIKRINALPGVTAEKKANLIEKMHKARSMERLTVIPFDVSQANLRKAAVDDLLKAFALPEMRDKLSDPTTILVVAGYADTGGRVDLNLRISQERAENISRILKEQAKLPNAMQTIGMGGTELLDSKRPDQNRAVEVWAVVPF
jgi:serine/threonine protein kinase